MRKWAQFTPWAHLTTLVGPQPHLYSIAWDPTYHLRWTEPSKAPNFYFQSHNNERRQAFRDIQSNGYTWGNLVLVWRVTYVPGLDGEIELCGNSCSSVYCKNHLAKIPIKGCRIPMPCKPCGREVQSDIHICWSCGWERVWKRLLLSQLLAVRTLGMACYIAMMSSQSILLYTTHSEALLLNFRGFPGCVGEFFSSGLSILWAFRRTSW